MCPSNRSEPIRTSSEINRFSVSSIRRDMFPNRGMIGLVASGVDVGWSEAEPFGYAESVDSVREMSVTRETDLMLWVGPS